MNSTSLLSSVALSLALLQGCAANTRCIAGPTAFPSTERTAADGTCLRAFSWTPEGKPRAVLVVVHGLRDYAIRYDALAQSLKAKGFLVVAQDHRGHGHSGGDPVRMESVEQLVADVDGLVQETRKANPGVPLFMLGHSMGGLVAADWALAHQDQLAGLVLSGPGIVLPPSVSGFDRGAVGLFGAIAPGLHLQDLPNDEFLSPGANKEAFLADPLIDHRNIPAATAKVLLRAIDDFGPHMGEFTVPLLAIHGEKDVITEIDGSRQVVAKAASTDKRLILYPGQRHDLAHEPDAPKVIADVTGWLDAHVAGSPAPAAPAPAAPAPAAPAAAPN